MKAITGATILFLALSFAICMPAADADLIKFKRGAKKRCVILEEDKEWVTFLTSYGETKMPMDRIESIEHESEEVNNSLEEKWNREQEKTRKKKPEEKAESAAPKKPEVARTYNIEIKRRRIMVGARSSGLRSDEPVATFIIKDMGMVDGSRLFSVSVTSYKSTSVEISPPDFHVLSTNGMRFNPHPLKGYDDLDARLFLNKSASGYISFPTNAKLEKLVYKSELADFELNLETGDFVNKEGAF